MATGCSEGDNTPAVVNPNSTLKITVGLNSNAAKGYDCPVPARMVVGLQTTGGWDEIQFAEKESANTKAWQSAGNNRLEMFRDIPKALARKDGLLQVTVFDGNNGMLGAYVCKNLDLTQRLVERDFTKDSAERFIKEAEFTKEATLNPADYPDNTIKMNVGAEVEVKNVAVAMFADGVPVGAQRLVADFTLASDSANLEIVEGKTVVGKTASDANALKIACKDGATGTANVIVVGENKYPVTLAIDKGIDQPDFAAGDKVTVKYKVGGGEARTAEITSAEDYEFYADAVGTTVAITEVELYTKATETTRKAAAFEPAEVVIAADAIQNVVTVTEWEATPVDKYPVTLTISNAIDQPNFDNGDKVTISYSVNSEAQAPVEVTSEEGYTFYKGEADEVVTVTSVAWTSNEYNRNATEFDPATPEVTISAGTANTIAVVKWADLPPSEYEVTLKIGSEENPDFAAGDTVTINFTVNGVEEDPVVVTSPEGYAFYKGVVDEIVKVTAVAWSNNEVVRPATEFDPSDAEVTISADAENTIAVVKWADLPPSEYEVTLKIGSEENPDFAVGDTVTINFTVNGVEEDPVVVTSPEGYAFYKGVVDEIVKVTEVAWFHNEVVRQATVFDPSDAEVTIADSGSNTISVENWSEPPTYGVKLAIDSSIEQPDFDAEDVVYIHYTVNGGDDEIAAVTDQEGYVFYKGTAGTIVNIIQVEWQKLGDDPRRAETYSPQEITISAVDDNTATVTAWEAPRYGVIITYYKRLPAKPDFAAGDYLEVTYQVDGGDPQEGKVVDDANHPFYAGKEREAVTILSARWYKSDGTLHFKGDDFDPRTVTVSSSTTNAIMIGSWVK